MTGPKRANSFDVARLAGVSRSAVSRTFTPGASVAPETRDRVMQAAQQLGYRVNTLARGLQTRQSQLVAILASRMDTPIRARQVKLLTRALLAEGFRPLLLTAESGDDVPMLLSSMLGYQLSGMIVTSDSPPAEIIEECAALSVPVVLINRNPEIGPADRVQMDADAAGRMAFAMLHHGGARHMAALLPDDRTYTVAGRVLAFEGAAKAAGLPCDLVAIPTQSYAAGRAAISRDWDRLRSCDGLFAATDLIAIGALDGLRLDKGARVPETMQVVGFDDIEQAGWGAYDLSTIRQDVPEQVALAVSAMRARLDHPDAPFSLRTQTLTAVPRGTTRNGPKA